MTLFYSYDTTIEKAYIIRIKNHKNSEELSKRCSESCLSCGMSYEFWDAYDGTKEEIIFPNHHNMIMDMMKITNHHLTNQEICCLLSHISLWAKCVIQDKPIAILEHDAIMVRPYLKHEIFNSIAYLGCTEQYNGWQMYFTPPHGTDGPNNHFILRTHAYAVDPAVAKNLLSHVIKYGLYTSADKLIRADLFPMHQTGGYAYDGDGETTINQRAEHSNDRIRKDEIKISKTGYWKGDTAHLGHVYSKELGAWITNFLKNQEEIPVYDLGCGLGNYLKELKENGFNNLTGYEAEVPANAVFKNIKEHDLTKELKLENKGNIISLEVGEHIPLEYMDIYLNNITNNCLKYAIISWAIPNQSGSGHVNCLENKKIISLLEERSFKFLSKETSNARGVIKDDCFWFKNTILIFEKLCT